MELAEEGLRNVVADTSEKGTQSTMESLSKTRDQRANGGKRRMEKELTSLYKILCMVSMDF